MKQSLPQNSGPSPKKVVDSGGVAYGEYVYTLDGDRLEDEYDEFVAI